VHGSQLATFASNTVSSIRELFDWTLLNSPSGDMSVAEEWWFSFDEVRRIFSDAASRGTSTDAASVMISRDRFLAAYEEVLTYTYFIETDELFPLAHVVFSRNPNNVLRLMFDAFGMFGPIRVSQVFYKMDTSALEGLYPDNPEFPLPGHVFARTTWDPLRTGVTYPDIPGVTFDEWDTQAVPVSQAWFQSNRDLQGFGYWYLNSVTRP
jgi:hypothetical protein